MFGLSLPIRYDIGEGQARYPQADISCRAILQRNIDLKTIVATIFLSVCIGQTMAQSATDRQASSPPPKTKHELNGLEFMAGHWRVEKDGRVTEEIWMAPAGGLMLGINRTSSTAAGRKANFENLQIRQEGDSIAYLASPQGKSTTRFELIELGKDRVVFENLKNEFPQRIIYYRKSDGKLTAKIEGVIQEQTRSLEWHWDRVQANSVQAVPVKRREAMMHGLRTVVYKVDDLEKAKQWYSAAFETQPYFDEPFYVGFNIGGFELGLDPDVEATTRGDNQYAYWGVDNCQQAYDRLLKKGAKKHEAPKEVGGGIVVASVHDPFGNVIGVIQNPHFKLEDVR